MSRRPSELIAKVANQIAWFEKYRTSVRELIRPASTTFGNPPSPQPENRHMSKIARVLALAGALALPASTNAQTAFESMDVFQLEFAADPQISPDGSQVVYVRSSMDIMRDRVRSELWIVNADGSGHRRLGDGGSPRWSPDGTRLASTRGADRSTCAGWTRARRPLSRSSWSRPAESAGRPTAGRSPSTCWFPIRRRNSWRRRNRPRAPSGPTRPSWRTASRTGRTGWAISTSASTTSSCCPSTAAPRSR